MKYYKVNVKSYYEEMIAPRANFINKSYDEYFKKISNGEVILDAPKFDYFYLESFDNEKYWEWNLFDILKFIGEASRMLGALLISKKAKKLFENFKISEPHFYYNGEIIYKNEKMEYYIFQFTGKIIFRELTKYINFSKSEFLNPTTGLLSSFKNIDDYIEQSEKLYFEKDTDFVKKKLIINTDLDFFPMQSFFKDNLVSERFKQAIEENGITGFEFSELDYEVVIDKENAAT